VRDSKVAKTWSFPTEIEKHDNPEEQDKDFDSCGKPHDGL